jgi:hypothetical protein
VGLLTAALLARSLAEARTRQAVEAVHSAERAELYERADRRRALGASRSRWLHDHGAEASFPCGVVHPTKEGADDEGLAMVRGMNLDLPVTAAVLADEVAFLAEPPPESGIDEVLEVGRIPIPALTSVDVVDARGEHLPEVDREGFEEGLDVWLVVRWSVGDVLDEETFRFRSTWLAWEAARRFRALRPLP